MSSPALNGSSAAQHEALSGPTPVWLEWLKAHVDPEWRTSEWDPVLWLFHRRSRHPGPPPGRAASPGCPNRRVATTADATPPEGLDRKWPERKASTHSRGRRRSRPTAKTACSCRCEGEVFLPELCFSHERSWRRTTLSVDEIHRAGTAVRAATSRARWRDAAQSVCPRRLCAFHDNRLRHAPPPDLSRSPSNDLATWVAGERPRTMLHHFYGEAHRSRALRAALCPAASGRMPPPLEPSTGVDPHHPPGRGQLHRRADPESICETGGCQYNSAIRGLLGDLRRHLDRAFALHQRC